MNTITRREKEALSVINKYLQEHGYPPTVRELAVLMEVKSTSTIHGYLSNLEQKGYIRREASKPRALQLIGNIKGVVNIAY
ncbi:LexA family protein [Paenibacillus aceti]|uniref:LexA repressor DNA-binding domain-containing protein n=1 Tax=Paenibacillus aceti TaxID=1820010 RepID=A0ABQ1VQH9_9BACL|nr:transcriptional regulator [Paenibacillus aceti]GGF87105.1 hypothetical protein GCM10010913_05730 [Paenibacillus aceti]